MLKLYFKVVEDQRIIIYKGGPKKDMKNEKTKVRTDRKEILMICARFYTELYSSPLHDQHPSLKNTSPDSSEVPLIMISEVKKTLNEIKSNNATGIDKLASDVMILRGEKSVKQMPTKFYKTDTRRMERSQDDNTTQKRRRERHSKLQASQSASPHVQTVHTGITNNKWKMFWKKTNQENRPVSEKVTQLLIIFIQLIIGQKNVMN